MANQLNDRRLGAFILNISTSAASTRFKSPSFTSFVPKIPQAPSFERHARRDMAARIAARRLAVVVLGIPTRHITSIIWIANSFRPSRMLFPPHCDNICYQ